MNTNTVSDVLIVGAGPVGMTAAAELTRHGASVRIVDKRPGPVTYSQAAAVHVRMQEILRAMGIVDGWLAAGQPLARMSVRAFGKKKGVLHLDGIDSPFPGPLIVGQEVTERLLNEHLERLGVKVERQVEAVGFSQDDEGVQVTLRHLADGNREETARAPWVVACEGSASKAREAAGIPFEGEAYTGTEFVQADVKVHWSYPNGEGYNFAENDRMMILFPFDAEGHYRVLCVRPEQGPEHKGPPTLEDMQALLCEMAGDRDATLSEPRWLNRFRTQHRLAGRFREGRIFLAGDCGHVHVPVGGQGMNYGIQDAFNLAWKLAAVVRGEARPEPLLDSYNAERHAVDTALIHGTDEVFRSMAKPGLAKEMLMRYAGSLVLGIEKVQEGLRTMLSGIKIHYHGSPVVEDHGGSHGPAAGERAPDARVVKRAEQETGQLFDLIYPAGRWTLLLFGGLEPTAEACRQLAGVREQTLADFGRVINAYAVLTDPAFAAELDGGPVLVDREHTAHEKYGAKNACIYLVRPDGYVGFRGTAGHKNELAAYLRRIGIVAAAEASRP